MSGAALFDVDGTLVDSNYLHVYAWHRAFVAEKLAVDGWRIHRSIGMDGTKLVESLSGGAGDVDRLKKLHDDYYGETAHLLQPLPGARELLRRVAGLGIDVVLATSAREEEVAILRKVLDCEDVLTAVTDSGDVDEAKPEPRIVEVALERAGVGAARAVFVGDAVWDVQAAARAGVSCIALRSGGVADCELSGAGARAVYDGPRDLLDHLDESLIAGLTS